MIRYDYNMTAMFLAALTIAALSAHAKPSPYKYVERDPAKKICFAMYTVANETLKLAAQLYPLQEQDSSDIYLEIERNGKWERVAQSRVRDSCRRRVCKENIY